MNITSIPRFSGIQFLESVKSYTDKIQFYELQKLNAQFDSVSEALDKANIDMFIRSITINDSGREAGFSKSSTPQLLEARTLKFDPIEIPSDIGAGQILVAQFKKKVQQTNIEAPVLLISEKVRERPDYLSYILNAIYGIALETLSNELTGAKKGVGSVTYIG